MPRTVENGKKGPGPSAAGTRVWINVRLARGERRARSRRGAPVRERRPLRSARKTRARRFARSRGRIETPDPRRRPGSAGRAGSLLYPSGRADDRLRVFRAGGRTGAPVAEEREAGSGGGGDAANLGDAGHRVLGFLLRRFGGRRRRALWALGRVVWWKRLAGRCAVVRTRRRFLVGCNQKRAVGPGEENQKARRESAVLLIHGELRTRHGRGVGGDGDGRRLPAGLLQRRGGGRRPRLEAPRAGAGARVDDGAVPRGGPRGRPAEDPAPGVEVRRGHDVVGVARRVRRGRDRRAIRARGVDDRRRRRWLRFSRALPGGALAAPRLLRVRRRRRDVAPARLCAGARGIPRAGARGSEDQEDREEGAGGDDAEDEGGGRSGAVAARGVRGGRRRDHRRARRDLRPTPRVDPRRASRDLRARARRVAHPRVPRRVPRRRRRRSPARGRARRHRGRGARGARPERTRRVEPRAGAIVRDPDGARPGATPRSPARRAGRCAGRGGR